MHYQILSPNHNTADTADSSESRPACLPTSPKAGPVWAEEDLRDPENQQLKLDPRKAFMSFMWSC
jgi:hypothetical protein